MRSKVGSGEGNHQNVIFDLRSLQHQLCRGPCIPATQGECSADEGRMVAGHGGRGVLGDHSF